MITSEIILFGSVLISVALGLLLIALVVLYVRLIIKHNSLREEKSQIESNAKAHADEIIAKANNEASEIIKTAHSEATRKVLEAGKIGAEVQQKVLADMEKVAKDYAANYQKILEQAKSESLSLISSMSGDVKQAASQEIEMMRKALQEEVAKTQEATKTAISGAYAKIEKEIEAYKQARITKINESVFEILQQVALRVIGKSLTQSDHGELVIKSLEEAKKENVL